MFTSIFLELILSENRLFSKKEILNPKGEIGMDFERVSVKSKKKTLV